MIDILPIRNHMRKKIVDSGLIPATSIAWENRQFDPENLLLWIDEVVSPDGEGPDSAAGEYAQITFVYRVFAKAGDGPSENYTEQAEALRLAIARLFPIKKRPFKIGECDVFYDNVQRRVATKDNGMWLAPLDVTVKVYQSSPILD